MPALVFVRQDEFVEERIHLELLKFNYCTVISEAKNLKLCMALFI